MGIDAHYGLFAGLLCMDAQNDFFVSGLEINLRWQRVMMAQANYDENKTTNLLNGIVGGGQSFEPGMLWTLSIPTPKWNRNTCIKSTRIVFLLQCQGEIR